MIGKVEVASFKGRRRPKWIKVLASLVLIGTLCFGGLFGAVMHGSYDHINGNPQIMVILGCQVKPWGPSILLQDRLDKALDYLEDQQTAEECENDTYLKAWNAIPPTIPRCLRAFLARIVRNLSIDRYREKRVERPTVELEAAMAELSACIPTEAEQAEAVALSELLDRFLRTEEETDRRLFLGRYWHGAAVKDLAAGSGLSPNAVTKRLAKTRERLRAYLTERGYSL